MTGNVKLLCNFVEKFLGTVRFGNDRFAAILGYGDLVQGNITINRVYYVEGLNHNLFSVGQFCDADLEVAFRKSTCFVRDLSGNDLLTGNRGSDLYTISLQQSTSSTPLCLMAKASPTQAWLWHRRLSHLNFDYINLLSKKDIVIGLPKLNYIKDQLCSSCKLSKAKRSSFKSKAIPSSKGRLNLLHMDLCGPMRVASINGYTWTLFLQEGIKHHTSTARTPEQNGIVERQNRTLVEAARTMLSASILPLFFWAEAIATACYTQNRSIIISTHDKTAYHIINDRKPSIKHLHIFCCTCYITRDGKNLDKMKEKGDLCILVGYSTQSKGYRVYNKRTILIVESIHIRFDEIKEVSETFVANDTSGLVPQRQKVSDYDNPNPPTMTIQPTSAPSTPTYVHAEENNDDQAEEDHLPDDEFTNPFCAPVQEVAESSSHNIDADLSGNPIDQTKYRSKIGSLMYLTSSRPDIVQAGSSFGLTAFSNVDHAGCIDSCKSTPGGIQFLGDNYVDEDTTSSLWLQHNKIPLYCDSQSAIAISCNPVQHSRTKHIHTRYHFIKEQFENSIIELYFVRTEYQLPDMFTKSLPGDRFKYLIKRIGIRCLTPAELEVLANEYA
uniref:Retrovirus-related Pol polyprotein from transposon TNT 1-94 n=1 Tax=Tanacetum cinerariifolium TaxID=118510 RepID=A0A6L2M8I2_TANCI|nr:retrovirus-related Pol polyprotein from transposon TNT 1-94 [Tanacetum cinerariifolium]